MDKSQVPKQFLFKDRVCRKFCLWAAKTALKMVTDKNYTPNPDVVAALKTVESYLEGKCTEADLEIAHSQCEEARIKTPSNEENEMCNYFSHITSCATARWVRDSVYSARYNYVQLCTLNGTWRYLRPRDMLEAQNSAFQQFNRILIAEDYENDTSSNVYV